MKQVSSLGVGKGFKKTEIGEIPADWEVAKLGDICEVVGGGTPATKKREYWDGDMPWATPTDITSLKTNTIESTEKTITKEGLSNSAAKLLPAGSILLTSRATIGECAINTVPMATNQGFTSLVCKKAHNWYIYHYLRSIKHELVRLASGSTFKEISKKSIRSLAILLPPLNEQNKISETISVLDDAFQKLSEVIEKTKLLKKGMMRRILTLGIGHTKFKTTEIGKMPAAWEHKDLSSLSTRITKGTTPTTYGYPYSKDGVLFLRIENISENGSFNLQNAKHISKETHDSLGRSRLKSGDILISIAGAIGRVSMVTDAILPANINQALALVRISERNVDQKYLFYALQGKAVGKQVAFLSSQLAQANLSLTQVGTLTIPLPPLTEQSQIALILSSIDEDREQALKYQAKLGELKNALMRVLLTGRVRVKV